MLYYFLVDLTNNGNYYTIAVSGDSQENIEEKLYNYFQDVRFMYKREKKKRDNATGVRSVMGITLRYCKFAYDMGTNRTNFRFEMIPDKRHTVG